MPSSLDGDSSMCPYSQLLLELNETYSFALDEQSDGNSHRSNSVLLETLSSDDAPVSHHVRRSSSCEPRPKTIRWRHHLISNPDFSLRCFHPPTTPVSSPSSSQSSLFSDETEECEASPPSKPLRPKNRNSSKELPDANKKNVASFKRSLRLLGLSPTDLGLNNPTNNENCSTNTPKRRCCTPRPRLFTRLTRKSVSLDDVRKATPLMLSDENAHRVVANAVYEEWYFGKQSAILRRKKEEVEEERRKAEQKALEKEELLRRSEEKFNEWLQRKIQQKKESEVKRATSAPSPRRSYQSRLAVTPDQTAEAFYKWLEEKERQKRRNKNIALAGKHTHTRRQPDPERQKEAQKVYQHWKQEVDENRRKEQMEKRRKQEEEELGKRKREQERLEDARRSYQHWKSRKEQEMKEKQEKKRLIEFREKQRQQEKKGNRTESASKAFLDWLDAVEERSLRVSSASKNVSTVTVASNSRRSQAAF